MCLGYTYVRVFIMFFFSSRRRHTRCALVTGVQTCALPILLANPGLAVPTAGVFAARAGSFSTAIEPRLPPAGRDAFLAWLALRGNDLEAPACRDRKSVV